MLLAWLQSQSWPGNVRELKHNAERFVLGLLTHHQPVPMTQQEESGLTACIDAFEKKVNRRYAATNGRPSQFDSAAITAAAQDFI